LPTRVSGLRLLHVEWDYRQFGIIAWVLPKQLFACRLRISAAGTVEECESGIGVEFMSMTSKRITLALPEIGLIAMTRGALGVGIGLLLSNGLEKDERRSAGLALLAVGVLTTIPILLRLRNELK
jgi:hypothetical protein